MATIAEMFSQPELLNYLKNRQYPALVGEQLFPEVKRNGLEFEMILGASKRPVIASVHAFDTEMDFGSRSAEKQALELAFIKRGMQLKEKDIIALKKPRDAAEARYLKEQVYNDLDVLVAGVRARIEGFRMEALTTGKITPKTAKESKVGFSVDYGISDTQKEALSGTAVWTNENSDPIADMERWADSLPVRPTRALTSRNIRAALLRHPKMNRYLFGTNTGQLATMTQINAFLAQHDLPQIAVYDGDYDVENVDGTFTRNFYIPRNSFTMFADGPLGETIYGPTPEEVELMDDPTVDLSMVGKIVAMSWTERRDPVGTYFKAAATALPSFPAANEVFQARPIA